MFIIFLDCKRPKKIVQWDSVDIEMEADHHSENNNLIKKFAVIPLLARTAVFGEPKKPKNQRKIRNSLSTYSMEKKILNLLTQRLA